MIIPLVIYGGILLFSNKKNAKICENYTGGFSLIIPCYNEEKNIKKKIISLINECKYVNSNNEIIIVSDGSNDNTNQILLTLKKQFEINIFIKPKREGKANALNLAIGISKYPILIFSDTRQLISKKSIHHLLKHFNDKEIGGVSSILLHKNGKSIIRNFINKLKLLECKNYSTVGVYGGLYAVRKNCVTELPKKTILDDLLISLFVLKNNKRVIIEPKSIIYDLKSDQYYSKQRVLRILFGLIQIPRLKTNTLTRLPFKALLFLYVQKYTKLTLPIFFIFSTLLAIYSSKILIFHSIICFSLISFLLTTCIKAQDLFRFIWYIITSAGSFKKYNTNLWFKI